MATQTAKNGFNIWNDADFMDADQISANFVKLDGYSLCKTSTDLTSTATGSRTCYWTRREYCDGTIELIGRLSIQDNIATQSGGLTNGYVMASDITVNIPTGINRVNGIQLTVQNSGICIPILKSNTTTNLVFNVYSPVQNTGSTGKMLYITVKGHN